MAERVYANYTDTLGRVTDCCAAYPTIAEDGALYCKVCYKEVSHLEGAAATPIDRFTDGQINRPRLKKGQTVSLAHHHWVQWYADDTTWVITGFNGWLVHSETRTNDWDIAHAVISKLAKTPRTREGIVDA